MYNTILLDTYVDDDLRIILYRRRWQCKSSMPENTLCYTFDGTMSFYERRLKLLISFHFDRVWYRIVYTCIWRDRVGAPCLHIAGAAPATGPPGGGGVPPHPSSPHPLARRRDGFCKSPRRGRYFDYFDVIIIQRDGTGCGKHAAKGVGKRGWWEGRTSDSSPVRIIVVEL